MEITPATSVTRTSKVRVAKKSVPKSGNEATPVAAKKPPAVKRARKVVAKKLVVSASVDVAAMVAEAAYYRAEHRQFTPGHELEDWLAAEQQVLADIQGK